MVKKILSSALHLFPLFLVLICLGFPKIAHEETREDLRSREREALFSNGEWECHCTCKGYGESSPAELPGDCASQPGGNPNDQVPAAECTFPDDKDGETWHGTLEDCHNVFVVAG